MWHNAIWIVYTVLSVDGSLWAMVQITDEIVHEIKRQKFWSSRFHLVAGTSVWIDILERWCGPSANKELTRQV
jgi:hypothetical protein